VGIFEYLYKKRNKSFFLDSDEYAFFLNNRQMLKKIPQFAPYSEASEEFDVLSANIIIRSILNKRLLDEEIEESFATSIDKSIEEIKREIDSKASSLPKITYSNYAIYIPFFDKATNMIYAMECEKLFQAPYDDLMGNYEAFLLDPFLTYGVELFASNFTSLIPLAEDETSEAFYHEEFKTVFVINRQGSLDCAIHIYDRKMHPNKEDDHIANLKKAMELFYSDKKSEFLFALYSGGLISYSSFRSISKELKI
jgi:hypothetical protein